VLLLLLLGTSCWEQAAAAAPAALDLAGPISTLCAAAAAIMAKLMELGGEVTRSEE